MAHKPGTASLRYQQKLRIMGERWSRGRRAAGRLVVAALVVRREKETAKANERPIKVCSTFLGDCMQMFYRMREMGDNHKGMIVSTCACTNVGI